MFKKSFKSRTTPFAKALDITAVIVPDCFAANRARRPRDIPGARWFLLDFIAARRSVVVLHCYFSRSTGPDTFVS
jgi:hypothetical protein